jgi:hypothetical protein
VVFRGYVVPSLQGRASEKDRACYSCVGGEKTLTEVWEIMSSGLFCCADW